MMKNKLLILFALGLSVLLSGCLKEDTCSNLDTGGGALHMTLSIGDPKDVQTRSEASTRERQINNLVVLVFDQNTGKYKDGEIVDITRRLSGSNGDQLRTLTANLTPTPGDKLVLLVNTTATSIPLQTDVSTTDDINAHFSMEANLNLSALHKGESLPMSGETFYSASGTTCRIYRSVAKIELALAPDLGHPDNDVTGNVDSYPNNISWSIRSALNTSKGAVYAPENTVEYVVKSPLASSDFGDLKHVVISEVWKTMYIPEYPSANNAKLTPLGEKDFHTDRTCILLEISRKYYRLDLYDHNISQFINIRRNTHITVTIKKVKSEGYSTIEEAMANPGSNLEYEIHVKGDNDDIVISNGQYALSLSNDIVEIYETNAEELTIATGRIILPTEMTSLPSETTNRITMSAPAGGVTLLTTSLTTTDTPIKVRFDNTDAMTFTLTVKVGNIARQIDIRRFISFDAHYSHYSVEGSMTGMEWDQPTDWIEVSPQEGRTSYFIRIAKENVTPIRWVVVDDSGNETPSSESNYAAIPIFEERYAEGRIFLSSGSKVKLIVRQKGPIYIGWFGGEPDNSGNGRYSKRLIAESIEESTAMSWDSQTSPAFLGLTDKERGLANTQSIWSQSNSRYVAGRYCGNKNDVNSDGYLTGEPFVWYLPAQNQSIAVWVVHNGLTIPWSSLLYWSSTEEESGRSWYIGLSNGNTYRSEKNKLNHVRCVRDL